MLLLRNETTARTGEFQVLCVWCGERIRFDNDEDSLRTCLECFYRMVNAQLDARRPTIVGGTFASER